MLDKKTLILFTMILVFSAVKPIFFCNQEYYDRDSGYSTDACYQYYYEIAYNNGESSIDGVTSLFKPHPEYQDMNIVSYSDQLESDNKSIVAEFYKETVFWFESFVRGVNTQAEDIDQESNSLYMAMRVLLLSVFYPPKWSEIENHAMIAAQKTQASGLMKNYDYIFPLSSILSKDSETAFIFKNRENGLNLLKFMSSYNNAGVKGSISKSNIKYKLFTMGKESSVIETKMGETTANRALNGSFKPRYLQDLVSLGLIKEIPQNTEKVNVTIPTSFDIKGFYGGAYNCFETKDQTQCVVDLSGLSSGILNINTNIEDLNDESIPEIISVKMKNTNDEQKDMRNKGVSDKGFAELTGTSTWKELESILSGYNLQGQFSSLGGSASYVTASSDDISLIFEVADALVYYLADAGYNNKDNILREFWNLLMSERPAHRINKLQNLFSFTNVDQKYFKLFDLVDQNELTSYYTYTATTSWNPVKNAINLSSFDDIMFNSICNPYKTNLISKQCKEVIKAASNLQYKYIKKHLEAKKSVNIQDNVYGDNLRDICINLDSVRNYEYILQPNFIHSEDSGDDFVNNNILPDLTDSKSITMLNTIKTKMAEIKSLLIANPDTIFIPNYFASMIVGIQLFTLRNIKTRFGLQKTTTDTILKELIEKGIKLPDFESSYHQMMDLMSSNKTNFYTANFRETFFGEFNKCFATLPVDSKRLII